MKPTKDKEYLAAIRKLHCLACCAEPPNDPHHVKHSGSGGGDDHFNLLPLCRRCHQDWHRRGPSKFFDKHPWVWDHMQQLSWYWAFGRLRNEHYDKM